MTAPDQVAARALAMHLSLAGDRRLRGADGPFHKDLARGCTGAEGGGAAEGGRSAALAAAAITTGGEGGPLLATGPLAAGPPRRKATGAGTGTGARGTTAGPTLGTPLSEALRTGLAEAAFCGPAGREAAIGGAAALNRPALTGTLRAAPFGETIRGPFRRAFAEPATEAIGGPIRRAALATTAFGEAIGTTPVAGTPVTGAPVATGTAVGKAAVGGAAHGLVGKGGVSVFSRWSSSSASRVGFVRKSHPSIVSNPVACP